MTLRARLRQRLRRLGRPAHKSSDSEANTDVRRTMSTGGYAFKGGMVWKGGVNSSPSRITERPPPAPPFGGTGGISSSGEPRPQAEGESSAGEGDASG